MIDVRNLGFSVHERWLFRHLNLQIGSDSRIGLVGPNGAGKTTLMRIIAGEIFPEEGSVHKSRFASIGYLPQELTSLPEGNLLQVVIQGGGNITALMQDLESVQRKLENTDPSSPEYTSVLKEFGYLQDRVEMLDGYSLESRARQILSGLGFSVGDLPRDTGEFSGGWKMRIAMARLLLQNPFLLLLDEPTNHLDIESLQWLEEFLAGSDAALMIVSHDSRFLDNLTRSTLEIEPDSVNYYPYPYTRSREERTMRLEQLLAEKRNLDIRRREIERFIERFRYKASKASQVQSRIKMLERMPEIQIPGQGKKVRFRFPPAPRIGRIALQLKSVTKRYGNLCVFRDLNLTVERGDRIAVMGINGAGKSTLAKIIAGRENIQEGEIITGHNFLPVYFAQDQAEELNPQHTVLDSLLEVAAGREITELRSALGAFLFTGDDIFKKVSVLSGGEKSRLSLARILVQPSNFLILDEPTNHLDMDSRKALQEALKHYNGVLLIVSHDRDFLDPLVHKVFVLNDGKLRIYHGNSSDYLRQRRDNIPFVERQDKKREKRNKKPQKRLEAEKRALKYKLITPVKNEIRRIEELITSLENRKADLEKRLKDNKTYGNPLKIREMTSEYGRAEKELQENILEWEALNLKLDEEERRFQELWEKRKKDILRG